MKLVFIAPLCLVDALFVVALAIRLFLWEGLFIYLFIYILIFSRLTTGLTWLFWWRCWLPLHIPQADPYSLFRMSLCISFWAFCSVWVFCHDSSVYVALGYRVDDRGSRVRFPTGAGNFSLHHRDKNGSGGLPTFLSNGYQGLFAWE
jgi:hypothetical protein